MTRTESLAKSKGIDVGALLTALAPLFIEAFKGLSQIGSGRGARIAHLEAQVAELIAQNRMLAAKVDAIADRVIS